jgi:hypothetical protein
MDYSYRFHQNQMRARSGTGFALVDSRPRFALIDFTQAFLLGNGSSNITLNPRPSKQFHTKPLASLKPTMVLP